MTATPAVLLWMRGGARRAPHPQEKSNERRRDHSRFNRYPSVGICPVPEASLLQRTPVSEYRNNATSDAEAYRMRDTGEQIRSALAEQGYAPR